MSTSKIHPKDTTTTNGPTSKNSFTSHFDSADDIRYSDLSEFEVVGHGSFGQVFRCDYLGTEVAVKLLLPQIPNVSDWDFAKYFDREVQMMREARHPNIVQFMGTCVHDSKIYVVTEYVAGGNLKEVRINYLIMNSMLKWIPSEAKKFFSVSNTTEDLPIFAVPNANEQLQPLEVTQIDTTHVELRQLLLSYRHRIAFGIDVGRALAYLHARGIIHRDLKLENLLLTENNRVKVCDFGLSRLVAKSEAERRRMSFCGSDGYMAPELILCLDEYDTSVDVFSLAIILLALFTLKIPSGDGPNEPPPFRRVIPGFGLDPTDIASAVPGTLPNNEKLVQLIQKCTNEDMKKRATVKDVLSVFKETETMICVRLREEEFQMSTSSGRRGTAFPFNVGVPISTAMQRSTQLLGSAASLSSSTTDISPLAPIDTRSRETINLWGPGQQVITSPLSPLSMTRFGYGASAPSLENIASNTTLNESMPKTQSGLPLNRSRHDIPHRFSLVFSALSLQVIRCHYCGKSIQSFMHSHVECDDCGYTSHKKCARKVPPTCGQKSQKAAQHQPMSQSNDASVPSPASAPSKQDIS